MKLVRESHVLEKKSAKKVLAYASPEKNLAETAASMRMLAAQMVIADPEKNVNQAHAHLIAQI